MIRLKSESGELFPTKVELLAISYHFFVENHRPPKIMAPTLGKITGKPCMFPKFFPVQILLSADGHLGLSDMSNSSANKMITFSRSDFHVNRYISDYISTYMTRLVRLGYLVIIQLSY